jgi:hypothetical protein
LWLFWPHLHVARCGARLRPDLCSRRHARSTSQLTGITSGRLTAEAFVYSRERLEADWLFLCALDTRTAALARRVRLRSASDVAMVSAQAHVRRSCDRKARSKRADRSTPPVALACPDAGCRHAVTAWRIDRRRSLPAGLDLTHQHIGVSARVRVARRRRSTDAIQ